MKRLIDSSGEGNRAHNQCTKPDSSEHTRTLAAIGDRANRLTLPAQVKIDAQAQLWGQPRPKQQASKLPSFRHLLQQVLHATPLCQGVQEVGQKQGNRGKQPPSDPHNTRSPTQTQWNQSTSRCHTRSPHPSPHQTTALASWITTYSTSHRRRGSRGSRSHIPNSHNVEIRLQQVHQHRREHNRKGHGCQSCLMGTDSASKLGYLRARMKMNAANGDSPGELQLGGSWWRDVMDGIAGCARLTSPRSTQASRLRKIFLAEDVM